jgi:hypothetical protein
MLKKKYTEKYNSRETNKQFIPSGRVELFVYHFQKDFLTKEFISSDTEAQ